MQFFDAERGSGSGIRDSEFFWPWIWDLESGIRIRNTGDNKTYKINYTRNISQPWPSRRRQGKDELQFQCPGHSGLPALTSRTLTQPKVLYSIFFWWVLCQSIGVLLSGCSGADRRKNRYSEIPQIVWAESASFNVPVYSSVYCQPPYEIHLLVNTVFVLFPVFYRINIFSTVKLLEYQIWALDTEKGNNIGLSNIRLRFHASGYRMHKKL